MQLIKLLSSGAVAALVACRPPAAIQPAATRPLVAETKLFSFHSDFWVNLHHFLYMTARARAGMDATRSATIKVLVDTVGVGALSLEQRNALEVAIAYYARAVAPRDILFDSSLVAVNDRLVELEDATRVGGAAGLDTGIATALDRAAPVYRALWWPRHDAANRRWIAQVLPVLAEHGDEAARIEARAFRTPWSATPVRVDATAYTNWAGAYTTEYPSHINVGSVDEIGGRATSKFETLFHEVLHTMDDSLFLAVQAAFREKGKRMPRDPTHTFIFFTAGEVTGKLFPGYISFAEEGGLWTRNPEWARMLPLLRTHWRPYLEGRGTLQDAVGRIADAW
jgi:hypothetical protein